MQVCGYSDVTRYTQKECISYLHQAAGMPAA